MALLASSQDSDGVVGLNAEGAIYRGALTEGQIVQHQSKSGGKLFLYVISGALSVNDTVLEYGDQGRIANEKNLEIISGNADFLMIETPA